MKFCTFTLIDNSPDPISGEKLSTAERFAAVARQAQWAEELGFDGFGIGERHAQRFISSSPPIVLAYIAGLTSEDQADHHGDGAVTAGSGAGGRGLRDARSTVRRAGRDHHRQGQ